MEKQRFDCLGETIVIPIPKSYVDCVTLIKSDYYRIAGTKPNLLRLFLATIRMQGFQYLFWMRMCSYRGLAFHLCKLMYRHYSKLYGVSIPYNAKIGYGLYIGHAISIVVNGGTVIGNNVNLSQMVNIGTNHNTPAIVGNNVYIGPMACCVENVKIGSGACIGAGAVVTKDIPACEVAVGIPAVPIHKNTHMDYICHPYDYSESDE